MATATIVTSAFVKAAEAHRKLLKQPELAYAAVPHPIVSMSGEALDASADAILDAVVSAISRIKMDPGVRQDDGRHKP